MAVTVIGIEDTIGGAVRRLGESVGDALDATVFAKGLKEKELRKDAAGMQGLVLTVRAAQRAGLGAMEGLAKGLNVNVEFLDEILAFTPTLQQATEERAIIGGAAQAAADAMVNKNKLEGATALALFEAGEPALNALARINGLEVDAAQSELDLEILNIRKENGVITSILKEEKLTAELGAQTAQEILSLLNNIDQSTEQGQHDAMALVLGLRNPAGLQHFQFHENMAFQESLAFFNAARASELSDSDKIALSLDLEDAWQTVIKKFEVARESGEDDLIEEAVADVNNVRLMIQKANEANLVFEAIDTSVASFGRGFFGGLKAELIQQNSRSQVGADTIDDFLEQLAEQGVEPTLEQLEKVLSSEASIADPNLTPKIRAEILEDFPSILARLRELGEQDLGILSKGSLGGEVIREVIKRDPLVQSIGAGLSALSELYTKLSEPVKAVLDVARTPIGEFTPRRRPLTTGGPGRTP